MKDSILSNLCHIILDSNRNFAYSCYFRCAGITLRLESEYPLTVKSFHPSFKLFKADGSGEDIITIGVFSELPLLGYQENDELVSKKVGWTAWRVGDSWMYLKTSRDETKISCMAAFNRDHTKARICSVGSNQPNGVNSFLRYNDQTVLTQIPLAYALANCGGCFIHSSGVVLDGKGVLFVGCSGAGKSTIKRMILSNSRAEPLCDERNIIRKWPDGYQVHGVWANKDLSDVSATSSPLGAIMFLEQSNENRVSPIGNRIDIIKRLLTCVLGPAESAEWWDKSLKIMGDIAKDIPCYRVNFDLSGQIVKLIEDAVSRI